MAQSLVAAVIAGSWPATIALCVIAVCAAVVAVALIYFIYS